LVLQVSLPARQEAYQHAFSVAFENDMFNKMDWHYTYGLQLLLYHNTLQRSPFDRLLLPFRIRGKDAAWYGLALRQELYTPRDLEDDATLQGGLFNKTSPHVIPSASVSRLVGDINVSLVFEIRKHRLSIYQHLTTSRFNESGWHGWLGIAYGYWW